MVLALLLTFLDVAVRGSSEGVSADAEGEHTEVIEPALSFR